MSKYYAVGTLLAFMVCLTGTHAAAAISPQRLQMLNLNLYATPCPANELTLRDMRGTTFNLSSLRGKVILLNFWRIDCPPCAVEKPILERIYRRYADRGLAIVAVNLFDDPDKIREYRHRGGFTYTFACDPWNRLSVRRQHLGSGMPTCFVVNSASEAIYEIKAVPTTYVINRQGRVVAHSTGIVNWQQGPLLDYLEALLGPPPQRVAQRPRNPHASSTHVVAPLATRKPKSSGPTTRIARSPDPPSSSRGSMTTLPFQGVTVPKAPYSETPKAPTIAPPSTPKSPTTAREKPAPKAPPPGSTRNVARSKPTPKGPHRQPAVSRGTPRTFSGSSGQMPSRSPVRSAEDLRPTARSASPRAGRPSPVAGTQTLPYLPPAIPYTGEGLPRYTPTPPIDRGSGRARSTSPHINLDKDVTTMARVPSGPLPSGYVPPRPAPPPRESRGLPSAVPMKGMNPIRGFVLDSFRSAQPRPVPLISPAAQEAARRSDSSLFGQLGKIGSGVKEALSRMMPAR
ncbi:MAG: redoxin domain-containing protein [Deltaproteobacteria bacterium]